MRKYILQLPLLVKGLPTCRDSLHASSIATLVENTSCNSIARTLPFSVLPYVMQRLDDKQGDAHTVCIRSTVLLLTGLPVKASARKWTESLSLSFFGLGKIPLLLLLLPQYRGGALPLCAYVAHTARYFEVILRLLFGKEVEWRT